MLFRAVLQSIALHFLHIARHLKPFDTVITEQEKISKFSSASSDLIPAVCIFSSSLCHHRINVHVIPPQ